MKFKATVQQIQEMCANAVNASLPEGLGHMHYNPKNTFLPEHFEARMLSNKGGIDIDYWQGRMVKLYVGMTKEEGVWEIYNDNVDCEYQSWCHKYPSYKDLIQSVGAEVI